MSISVLRSANLMRSSPTLSMSNSSLKKSNHELVSALKYSLSNPVCPPQEDKLQDEPSEYEITSKLFFLPNATSELAERVNFIDAAVREVTASLDVETIDLLILSFPYIVLDADDAGTFTDDELQPILDVYRAAATLVTSKRVRALGISEFSAARLQQLCENVSVQPEVNQINLKDCCVTPRDLILYAKKLHIKLFTHGDCSDILPTETLREVLSGAKDAKAETVKPLWVCKYTAVASSRGVVENKGYLVGIEH